LNNIKAPFQSCFSPFLGSPTPPLPLTNSNYCACQPPPRPHAIIPYLVSTLRYTGNELKGWECKLAFSAQSKVNRRNLCLWLDSEKPLRSHLALSHHSFDPDSNINSSTLISPTCWACATPVIRSTFPRVAASSSWISSSPSCFYCSRALLRSLHPLPRARHALRRTPPRSMLILVTLHQATLGVARFPPASAAPPSFGVLLIPPATAEHAPPLLSSLPTCRCSVEDGQIRHTHSRTRLKRRHAPQQLRMHSFNRAIARALASIKGWHSTDSAGKSGLVWYPGALFI
jgi:hypothetical protein